MYCFWFTGVYFVWLTWSYVSSQLLFHPDSLQRGSKFRSNDVDTYRNVTELITSKGYPCEEYKVVTEDGFILSLQRIPYGVNDISGRHQPRQVAFLQHGFLDSSATWVINSASQSLGFILADAGFDVWLGNMRGNTYSRNHVKLKPKDHQFWAWSWDEMARYDLPAMLNFVLATTGQSNLFYIGHSQGTLIAFVRFSQDQELAKKIKGFIALGPILTIGHVKGGARILADISPELAVLYQLLGVDEFLPNNELMKILATTFCPGTLSRYLCEDIVFFLAGTDISGMNITRLPVYIYHTPAGSSVQNAIHFSQMIRSNKCQMYDYGSVERNMLHYNQTFPPAYNISAFNVPTYIYSAENDYLSDPEDVQQLLPELKSVKIHKQLPQWNHLDFLWAVNANKVLYKEIIQVLKNL